MSASLQPDLPLPVPNDPTMSFSGRAGDFLKLLVKGSLLQIPTFGFYRFWLITKLRRHLWANTQIEGEAFEYTGSAKELLIGFLIALAVLVPLYIAYVIAAVMLEERAAFASLPLVLVMYVLAHFGSYRARKYRASRTIFRGVRFWMKGAGWAYALRAVLWDLATFLTLGLALPWAMAALERYRMRHTFFGSVQGGFTGTGWTLFKRGWWVWALGLALLIGFFLLSFRFDESPEGGEKNALVALVIVAMLSIVALLPLAGAIVTRWHIDGLRFGEAAAISNFRIGTYYGLFFKLIFSSLGFVIAFGLVAVAIWLLLGSVIDGTPMGDGVEVPAWISIGSVVLFFAAYLVALLGIGILQRYFFGRGLWAAIVTTTAITNLPAIDTAVAAGKPAGVLGEGLADALDFNVGI